MHFDILTIFPESFEYLNQSVLKRAQSSGLITIKIHNLRDWAQDKHKTVDDKPFGGGAGMLMKVDTIYKALKSLGVYPSRDENTKIVITSAKGNLWTQSKAKKYSKIERIVIICGRYEGVDHRVEQYLVDEEISIGEYVLSGGELAGMVFVDSVSRLIDGVLGNEESLQDESHNDSGLIEYPQYTRPEVFETEEGDKWVVPEVLLSGNHKEIESWKSSHLKNHN